MTPADLDPAALLAWIEGEMDRTLAEAEEATRAHLETIFNEEGFDPMAGRRLSQFTGKYLTLAEVAGKIRAGEFDRGRSE